MNESQFFVLSDVLYTAGCCYWAVTYDDRNNINRINNRPQIAILCRLIEGQNQTLTTQQARRKGADKKRSQPKKKPPPACCLLLMKCCDDARCTLEKPK